MEKTFYVKLCTPYWVGFFDRYPQWPKAQAPCWDMSVDDWKKYMGTTIKRGEIKKITITVEDE